MKTLLAFLAGVAVGAVGWSYLASHALPSLDTLASLVARNEAIQLPASTAATSPLALARFPVERTVTNRNGVAISARLLARNESEVLLVRLSDNAAFRYPLASLSDEDERFVRGFAENALPVSPTSSATTPSSVSAEELRLLQQRSEVEHQIEILQLELAKVNDPNPRLPHDEVRRQLDACRNLIISIDQRLTDLRFRNGR